ncbi:hypothetical protein IEZ26_13535 [Nocardioides cavernae]|uniref:Uncharacterized protein n=1 Tax=Nocardioides cavernae TaxID=1921566 RepID=A0ABR8NER7_9ACTN|nr:hypothetical protein [Nocardioides cavernae]MBD3925650.1 hypothetical protein [Nocardioides cavernae]MBM7513233.1 hypothetical protein [Nocardioides cavernae]
MSERLLDAFREEAERAIVLPEFERIEAAGRARRNRRHAVVGAAAACALVVTGLLAATGRDSDEPQPAEDTHSAAKPYPGPENVTLDEGTYELTPYHDIALPAAWVRVSKGWNASYGPDRFEGIGPVGADNTKALERSKWYAGLYVTELDWVAAPNCEVLDLTGAGVDRLLPHLTRLPRVGVTYGPDAATRFGHPAYHLRLKETRRGPDCPLETIQGAKGPLSNLGLGGTYDIWLIDLDGEPLLVLAGWTRHAPPSVVDELLTMADSLELQPRQRPWR